MTTHTVNYPRKATQMAVSAAGLIVIANDGSLWHWQDASQSWAAIPPLPDGEQTYTVSIGSEG